MNPRQLEQSIRSFCIEHENDAIKQKYARYFKEAYNPYGLTQELLEQKVEHLIKIDKIDLETLLQAAPNLIKTGMYEETSFCIFLAKKLKKQFTPDALRRIELWFDEGIQNWAHCDGLCGEVLWLFIDMGIVPIGYFEAWRQSPFRFKRRAVPVTLIKPMKRAMQFAPFFKIIEPLMADEERVVHQGVGWFLREAWKKQPEVTEAFLMKWKETAPRLIVQYATEKMTPDQKLAFRRTKK